MTVQEMGRTSSTHCSKEEQEEARRSRALELMNRHSNICLKALHMTSSGGVASITVVMAASHTTAQKHMRNAACQPTCRDAPPSTARGSLQAMDASAQRSRDLESADSSSGMIYREMHETQRVM